MALSEAQRGVAFALLGSFFAACFLLPWKLASRFGAADVIVLVMLTSAASCNSVLALARGGVRRSGGRRPPLGPTLRLALSFALLTLLGNRASAEAARRISGALLAVTQRSEIILVALMGAALLGERVQRPFWIGTAIAAAGLWLLNQPVGQATGAAAAASEFQPTGALFGVASACCFGMMVVLTRRYIAVVQLLALNTVRLWLSVALWFVVERRIPSAQELSLPLVASAAAAGFFGPFLSRLCALSSSRYVPANITVLASLATPVLTLLLSFLVVGTLPTRTELLGGAVMLAGIGIPVAAMWRR